MQGWSFACGKGLPSSSSLASASRRRCVPLRPRYTHAGDGPRRRLRSSVICASPQMAAACALHSCFYRVQGGAMRSAWMSRLEVVGRRGRALQAVVRATFWVAVEEYSALVARKWREDAGAWAVPAPWLFMRVAAHAG